MHQDLGVAPAGPGLSPSVEPLPVSPADAASIPNAFAPGPWHVCQDNPVVVRDVDDTLIADCDNFVYTDDGEVRLEWCEATARLIAAAPELLEALEFIEGFSSMPGDQWRARWPEWAASVDAALARFAKETGGFHGRGSTTDVLVDNAQDAVRHWVFRPLGRAAIAKARGK